MKIMKSNPFYVTRYCRHDKVTGSNFIYTVHWPNGETVDFVYDVGSKQGEDDSEFYNSFFPFDAKKISFVILSHNHFDHVGTLPVLVGQGFNGPIFTSYATANLLDVSLQDSSTIECKESGKTLATIGEVEKALNQVVGCTFKKVIKPHKNISIVFFRNGHLVGAVLTLIIITCPGRKDITIIHTGDYKDVNIFFNVDLPSKWARTMEISNTVCESTYGNIDSTHPMFQKCLAKNTADALKKGMTVLYPTFAQGRHQEVLYDIKTWQDRNIIPGETVVVIDGRSSQQYNAKYMYANLGIKKSMQNFMPKNTINIPRGKNKNIYRQEIISDPRPKIILAPGGMGSYGPITSYISKLMSRDDVLIHTLGYCSPESTMYKLSNTPNGETMKYNGMERIKRCQTKKTAEKTAHGQRDVLLRLIKYFPYTKSISINHGEQDVQLLFRDYLLDNLGLPEDQIITADSRTAVRIEADGITKIF